MPAAVALASVAAVGGVWRFVFRVSGARFWVAMAAATGGLGLGALALRGPGAWAWRMRPEGLVPAVGSAVLLYLLFLAGNRLVRLAAPAVSASGAAVYGLVGGFPRPVLAGMLLLVIGPGEEFYWRGLLQWSLGGHLPAWGAVVAAAALYAAVHLTTRSPALVLAALVCGLYWGAMYALTGSLPEVVVSHALWDCLVLLWLPLRPAGALEPGGAVRHAGRVS